MEGFVKKHATILRRASLVLLALLVFGGVAVFAYCDISHLNAVGVFDVSSNLVALVALSIICVAVFLDAKGVGHVTSDVVYFAGMLLAQCITLFGIETGLATNGVASVATLNLVEQTLVYVFSNVVMFFWWRYLSLQCNNLPRWHAPLTKVLDVLFVVTVLASLSNIFGSNLFFSIDDQGTYHRSSTYNLCLAYSLVCFIASAVLLATQKDMATRSRITLFWYILFPVAAIVLQSMFFGLTLTYLFTSYAITFLFGSVYIDRGRAVVKQEAELANQRSEVMLSQIKPHFLYNSLTAIADLCDEDPSQARELTLDFATYLRGNMDSLNEKEPILFTRELAHTKSYLAIEKARFGSKLIVEYDIQVTNFSIPALTVQPIVENAVKHGIKAKRGPGTVVVSTRDCGDEICVCVQDDGPGFDVDAAKRDGEDRSHLGISNVENRLRSMVGGSLEIVSGEGTGTSITLHIPSRGDR